MLRKIETSIGTPRIRVGVNSVWANMLVTSITPKFHLRYPGTAIELFDENHKSLKKYISDGIIDIAVLATDTLDNQPGYCKILRMEEIVFAVSKQNSWIQKNSSLKPVLTMEELMEHFGKENYILTKNNSSFRPKVNQALAEHNFHPNVICEVSNMNTVRNMVAHNIGVAFIPESIIDSSLDIAYFSLEPKITRYHGLICRSTLTFSEEEQHFIDLIEQTSV